MSNQTQIIGPAPYVSAALSANAIAHGGVSVFAAGTPADPAWPWYTTHATSGERVVVYDLAAADQARATRHEQTPCEQLFGRRLGLGRRERVAGRARIGLTRAGLDVLEHGKGGRGKLREQGRDLVARTTAHRV